MSLKNLKVGSDIVYYCSRCGLDLGHRILAMIGSEPARVRCNTCYSERNFRAKKKTVAEVDRGVRRVRTTSSSSVGGVYQQKLKENFYKNPKPYRADESFEVGDILQHPSFGKGVVAKLIFPDRMDVLFEHESKTLIRAASKESDESKD